MAHAHGHLFSIKTNDQMIFGQEMVTMLSVTLIAVILHWTVTSFKRDYSLTASRSMRIPCLISMISFLVMNVVGMIGWNNVFIPITPMTCKLIYPFCLVCYNFGKISMYYLFTFRIELIFEHTAYQISRFWLTIYRIFCFVLPSLLWSIWIYLSWNDIRPHLTDSAQPQYQYCFPQAFKYSSVYLAQHIACCIAITDLLFSGVPLFLFIFKYHQVTCLIKENNDLYTALTTQEPHNIQQQTIHNQHKSIVKHIGIIRKSTMLVIIAIISTWIYIIGQAYVLRQLGFYLPFDGCINSICIACLFQFGDDFYSVTFAKLECCCYACCYVEKKPNKVIAYTSSTSSPNAIYDDPNRNAIQYHAKIHSYPHSNSHNHQNNTHPIKIPTAAAGAGASLPTKLNIITPTQRYTGSPEQRILFSGPSSLTEFIPLNLKGSSAEETEDPTITPNPNVIFSQTADSALTDSTSVNMKPLKPANVTGSIPVISKYQKPSKISRF
eukprot:85048_1